MSALLEKLLKQSQANVTADESADLDCIITSISSITDDRKVKLATDKGTFFPFKNQFPNGKVPYVGKGLKATITLSEKIVGDKTFTNVTDIKYNVDELSMKQIAASYGNPITAVNAM